MSDAESKARKALQKLAARFRKELPSDKDELAVLPSKAGVAEVLAVCERLFGDLITEKAISLALDGNVMDAVRELQRFRRTLRREWLPSLAPVQARLEYVRKLPGTTPTQWKALARTPSGFFERLLHDQGLINIAWYLRHPSERKELIRRLFRRARKVITNEALRFPAQTAAPQADPRTNAKEERARRRQAYVLPKLAEKIGKNGERGWTRSKLVAEAGTGKTSVFGYLDGTIQVMTEKNRQAIADALGVRVDELPK
jgi:hypothetical protein